MSVSAEDFLDDKVSAKTISAADFLDGDNNQPQPDIARQAYRGVMNNVAKPINDTISSGIRAIGSVAKEVIAPTPTGLASPAAKQFYSRVGSAIGQSPIGVAVGEGVQQVKDQVNDLARYDQNLRPDLAAFGQNAQLAGNIPILKAAGGVAMKAANKFESASAKLPGILGDTASGVAKEAAQVPITPFQMEYARENAYTAVGQSKQVFGNLGSEYTQILEKTKAKPLPSGKLTAEDAALNSHLDDFAGLEGKPISIEDVQRIDTSLGQKINNAFNQKDKVLATKLMNVQDDFRDALAGTKAGDTLSEARTLAANNFRVNDLQEILNNARNYDNASTYIKNQFRLIAQNTRRLNSYDPQTQFMIKKIAKSNVTGDLMGIVGSRLNAIIGGAVGGHTGFMAGNATSMAARGARTALYENRAQKAINSIGENVRPLVEKYNTQGPPYTPPPIISGYLPAPTYYVNSAGWAATSAEREVLGRGYSDPNYLMGDFSTITPD